MGYSTNNAYLEESVNSSVTSSVATYTQHMWCTQTLCGGSA